MIDRGASVTQENRVSSSALTVANDFYRSGDYFLVLRECNLYFVYKQNVPPSNSSRLPDVLVNSTTIWTSNSKLSNFTGQCQLFLEVDGVITIATDEPTSATLVVPDRTVFASDLDSRINGGATLFLEPGQLVLRDSAKREVWNSLKAPRLNATTTVGFQQGNSKCGTVGYYKAFNGNTLANCIQPGQLIEICQYLRIGTYFLNMTEFTNLALYQGRPVEENPLLTWKSGEPGKSSLNAQFVYSTTDNLVIRDGLNTLLETGDLTAGLKSDEFCLLDTGIFGLFRNNSLVWSRPLRDGFNGFDDDICWSFANTKKTIIPIGRYSFSGELQRTCMKRGESIQPCQNMSAGNYTLGFQMGFTQDSRIIVTQGNLVMTNSSNHILWETGARKILRKQVTLKFNETGDVVVYDGNTVVSAIGTTMGKDSTDFCVQSDGRIVLYNVVGDKWNEVWSNPRHLVGFSGFGGDNCGLVGHKQTVDGHDASCMDPGDGFRTCQYMQVGSNFFTMNVNSTLLVYNGTINRINTILWSSQLAFNSQEGSRFTFGFDKTLAITKAIAANPFIPIVDVAISKNGEKLCLLSSGTLSLFDSKSNAIWTASIPPRMATSPANIYESPECGPRGHWRRPVDGARRMCLLPGESLRTCQWLNIDDLYFTWAGGFSFHMIFHPSSQLSEMYLATTARLSSPEKMELMIHSGSRYAKTGVFWSSGMDTPGTFNSLMYLDYKLDGNLVLTANGTAVVGVSNRLTDTQASSFLCLMSDASVKLFDVEDNVIWKNPRNMTGFSGSGTPCS
ncbi:UNVERIFIED_CONTAM: hypothetical protein HDU68_008874 [Siphonaria sp. JEL0065]|nr:hypothetical protein HDU68_008874 [Siphonaria sp. JEL0065]